MRRAMKNAVAAAMPPMSEPERLRRPMMRADAWMGIFSTGWLLGFLLALAYSLPALGLARVPALREAIVGTGVACCFLAGAGALSSRWVPHLPLFVLVASVLAGLAVVPYLYLPATVLFQLLLRRVLGALAPALRRGLRREDTRRAVAGDRVLRGAARATPRLSLARPARPFLCRIWRINNAAGSVYRNRRWRNGDVPTRQDPWRALLALPASNREAGARKRK